MLLLVAGISAFQLGAMGATLGVLCIVVALVWKVWAARLAPKLIEKAKKLSADEVREPTSSSTGADTDATRHERR